LLDTELNRVLEDRLKRNAYSVLPNLTYEEKRKGEIENNREGMG